MKTFYFKIEQTAMGLGYVDAETKEEAIKLIEDGEFTDIYDVVDTEYGDIIDISE